MIMIMISIGIPSAFALSHVDYSDSNWECKKWLEITKLAIQDYPQFVDDSLIMAEKKCGFDVSEFLN